MKVVLLFIGLFFLGCSSYQHPQSEFMQQQQRYQKLYLRSLQKQYSLSAQKKPLTKKHALSPLLQKRLSIHVKDVPFNQVVKLVGYSSGVSIILDRDISYPVSLLLQHATLKEVLDALTEPFGYSYRVRGNTIHLITYETKIFHLYIPASQRALGASLTSITSSGGGGQNGSSSVQLANSLQVDLWKSIEKNLQNIIRDEESVNVQISYTSSLQKQESGVKTETKNSSLAAEHISSNQQERAKQQNQSATHSQAKEKRIKKAFPLRKGLRELDTDVLAPQGRENNTTQQSRIAQANERKRALSKSSSKNASQKERQDLLTSNQNSNISKQKNVQIHYQLKPFVQIDRLTGLVLVKAKPRVIKKIKEYIDTLNKMFNQEILIDLEIVEFINTKDINRGVDWQKLFNDVKLFGNSGVVSIKQNLAPTLGGGIELTYHGADFSAFLAALSQQGYTRVVSSPRITTLNNQPALIKVGNDRILIYTKVESENTTTQNVSNSISSVSVERTPIVSEGLSLLVYPRYNEYSKTIILNITSILQKLSGKGSKDLDTQLANMVIADPSRFQTKPVPLNIETKQLNAVAKLKDGDVLVLGGLSSEVDTKERSFVPLLGEVPILRELFSNTKDARIKSFLILLLRVKKL